MKVSKITEKLTEAKIIISELLSEVEEENRKTEERRNTPILCCVCKRYIKNNEQCFICDVCNNWVCGTYTNGKNTCFIDFSDKYNERIVCKKCDDKITEKSLLHWNYLKEKK